ncbi:MAG TPA: pentapeptide repeat-containing protein, partial [Gaiellaceae bacterium]|nr:pentapeptide repeat-containing protein [Gaiellaceae bacterium]
MVAVVLMVVAVTTASSDAQAASSSACTATTRALTGTEVVACLRNGPVILVAARVHGVIDFRPLETVDHAFVCRGCRLDGVNGSDVVFAHQFGLTASRVSRGIDLQGAEFDRPALFIGLRGRGVDASLAVFNDLVSFDDAQFTGPVSFARARFRNDASFAHTLFLGAEPTDRSCAAGPRQGGVTAFNASVFGGSVAFVGTCFARSVNFARARFTGDATFEETQFV